MAAQDPRFASPADQHVAPTGAPDAAVDPPEPAVPAIAALTDELVVPTEREAEPAADPGDESRNAAPAQAESRTIGRLADDLLPTLIAHLDASGLGELEVRGAGWRVRLRKPYDRRQPAGIAERRHRAAAAGPAPRVAGGGRPTAPHGPGVPGAGPGTPSAPQQGHVLRPGTLAGGDGNGRPRGGEGASDTAHDRVDPAEPATSPVVGYFGPRDTLSVGRRVRSGDILGWVDCLGIRHEVVSPVDGVVAAIVAEPGEAVEYGQPLARIVPGPAAAPPPGSTTPGAVR